ncbi:MAG: hypothetical protein OXD43_15470 [Bacteroidetes bacterium]|nr:hypothetical protein [Bacteroidota bacterium]
MNNRFMDGFATELLYQWLLNASDDLSYAEVLLYDPSSMTEKYSASYFFEDDAYLLYRACDWEEPDADSEIIFSSTIEKIEHSENLSDICNALITLAKKERLLPQLTRCQISESID